MEIFSAFIILFMIMDPVGNIPIFMSALREVHDDRKNIIIIREMILALLILIIFLFLGPYILLLLSLTQEAIQISGAIVLFLIALGMIFPKEGGIIGEQYGGEPLLVPLAIPCVAGPSSMAVLILQSNSGGEVQIKWLIALIAAWSVSCLIMLTSTKLSHHLGKRGLSAIERLMGMILIMISVQMFLNGISEVFQTN